MKEYTNRIRLRRMLYLVFIFVSLIATQVPALSASPRVMVRGCGQLSPRDIPPLGSSGAIRFDCGDKAAFSATGRAVPAFDLTGTGYDSLGIILHSTPDCSSSTMLTTNGPFKFGGPRQGYDYCAFFADPTLREIGRFDIRWTIGRGTP